MVVQGFYLSARFLPPFGLGAVEEVVGEGEEADD